MRQGEYLEDKDVSALAAEYLEGTPVILNYDWEVIDNGSRKNTLGFDVDFMDPKAGVEEHGADAFDDALSRVNQFLEAVTGRTARQRKKDMKNDATSS